MKVKYSEPRPFAAQSLHTVRKAIDLVDVYGGGIPKSLLLLPLPLPLEEFHQ